MIGTVRKSKKKTMRLVDLGKHLRGGKFELRRE